MVSVHAHPVLVQIHRLVHEHREILCACVRQLGQADGNEFIEEHLKLKLKECFNIHCVEHMRIIHSGREIISEEQFQSIKSAEIAAKKEAILRIDPNTLDR